MTEAQLRAKLTKLLESSPEACLFLLDEGNYSAYSPTA